jgi:hypothetical protein
VYIDFTIAILSTIWLMFGSSSEIQAPDCPYCLKLYGDPSSFGTPLMNANRSPWNTSCGQGVPLSFFSSGL